MEQAYDTSTEKLQTIRKPLEIMMDLLAKGMDSHPQIVGACMVAVLADRYGCEALDNLISSARSLRPTLISREKAAAPAVRLAARR